MASAVAASDSTARSATTFCISGLSASMRPERRPVRDVPRGLGERVAHQRGRAEHAVEAGGGDHLDDRADAAALVAQPPGERAVELDLRRRVGAVAELVLEPDDVEPVAAAVGQRARHHEAGQPALGLREHEEDVVHRRGREPLVPVQGVLAVDAGRPGLRHVGADVGAALLLGHAHPGEGAGLVGDRPDAGVVRRGGQRRDPLLGERRRRRGGPARRRRSSRSGSRGRARSATRPGTRRRGVRGRGRRRRRRAPRARPAARARRPASSASATTGGRRPRRCGCRNGRTSSARACGCWPARRARAPRPMPASCPSAVRSSTTSARAVPGDGLDEGGVGGDDVVADQRRRLVRGRAVAEGRMGTPSTA